MLRPILSFAATLVFASALHAQTVIVEEPGYTPTLIFDVATIRQAPPPDANFHVSVTSPPHSSRFDAINLPMKAMLQIAYGFEAPVVGAPDWTTNTFWVIQARCDEATDARLAKLTDNEVRLEKRNAIRALLTERLGLKTHMETRTSSVYHLVVDKGGVKMQLVAAPREGEAPIGARPADVQSHASKQGLEFDGSNSPIRALTGALASMVEAPVLDKTGLPGTYNYTLKFGRDWSANDPDGWPSLFTAIQEQLGLKLEAVKEPVPNLVVDAIKKPTEN